MDNLNLNNIDTGKRRLDEEPHDPLTKRGRMNEAPDLAMREEGGVLIYERRIESVLQVYNGNLHTSAQIFQNLAQNPQTETFVVKELGESLDTSTFQTTLCLKSILLATRIDQENLNRLVQGAPNLNQLGLYFVDQIDFSQLAVNESISCLCLYDSNLTSTQIEDIAILAPHVSQLVLENIQCDNFGTFLRGTFPWMLQSLELKSGHIDWDAIPVIESEEFLSNKGFLNFITIERVNEIGEIVDLKKFQRDQASNRMVQV